MFLALFGPFWTIFRKFFFFSNSGFKLMLKYSSGVAEIIPVVFGQKLGKKLLAHFLDLLGWHLENFPKKIFLELCLQIDVKILVRCYWNLSRSFWTEIEKNIFGSFLVYYKSKENALGTRMFLALFGPFLTIFPKNFFSNSGFKSMLKYSYGVTETIPVVFGQKFGKKNWLIFWTFWAGT